MFREFYFGREYKFKTEEEMRETFSTLVKDANPYEINKNTFLNEYYTNENIDTKIVYYAMWKGAIQYIEEMKMKDLYQFSPDEIADLIISSPTTSRPRKESLFNFVKQYCDWAFSKELINVNPTDGLNREELVKINEKAIKRKVMGLNEFYDLCYSMIENTSPINVLPLVLARYGIVGSNLKYMSNLRWNDIDIENMSVNIVNPDTGEIITQLAIDNRFLHWIEIAKDTKDYRVKNHKGLIDNGAFEKISEGAYQDKGYVNKISVKTKEKEDDAVRVEKSALYSRINMAFRDNEMDGISLGSLEKSRKIELLLEKRKNRKLTTRDVQEIVLLFNPSASVGAYNALKNDYESITGDKVLPAKTKEYQLEDNNSTKFVNKIKKELKL
jgi:hypothetical protein